MSRIDTLNTSLGETLETANNIIMNSVSNGRGNIVDIQNLSAGELEKLSEAFEKAAKTTGKMARIKDRREWREQNKDRINKETILILSMILIALLAILIPIYLSWIKKGDERALGHTAEFIKDYYVTQTHNPSPTDKEIFEWSKSVVENSTSLGGKTL